MQRKKTECTVIVGASRSGKTTYFKGRVKNNYRLIVCDPKNDFSGDSSFVHISAIDGWERKLLETVRTGWRSGFRIRLYFPPDANRKTAFIKLCELVVKIQKPFEGTNGVTLTLGLDECAFLYPSGNLGDEYNPVQWLFLCGLGYGIDIICIAQGFNGLNKNIRENQGRLVVFRQGDIANARGVINSLPKGCIEKLEALKTYEYLDYDKLTVSFNRTSL